MARIRFSDDFDWSPRFGVTIAYKGGEEYTVKRECADAAVAAGKGKELGAPRKPDDGAAE